MKDEKEVSDEEMIKQSCKLLALICTKKGVNRMEVEMINYAGDNWRVRVKRLKKEQDNPLKPCCGKEDTGFVDMMRKLAEAL
jgi:hypothetical protein